MSATVEHDMWAAWPALRVATPALELVVVAGLGARIVSLRDRRRGREWLLGGAVPGEAEARAWAAQDAPFGGRESFGWDECLPTVAVCADPREPDGPPLRDHGDQWAREASVATDATSGSVEVTWAGARWPYRFGRRLSCPHDDVVLAEYTLVNQDDRPIPFLWSQHAVLALEAGSRLELPGVEHVRQTWQHGIDLREQPVWPLAERQDGRTIDLAAVRSGEGWAAKLYAVPPGPVAAVAPDGARLSFEWDRDVTPALGIWLAYGGWPADGMPVEQVALEPTTSSDDHLEGALAGGRARWLAGGESARWWVRLTVG